MISVKKIASGLLILNYYVSKFPELENKAFTIGDMTKIVICVIPKDWITCIDKSVMELRNMIYQTLIN